ncbi:hypothetical protein QAD02_016949 [Eretmocerus hayati]|uniref:Uncharacterized protein n=1 Tax=Eretmocerus hayati TaxID=131215 RepID=A0ACC2PFD4_9HYME|nr:hypothetical protein QAD02_016949 [Eretmocerus hayati]
MDDEPSQENNPWIGLPTVTNFDKGPNSCSTRRVGEKRRNKANKKLLKKVSSSSILIGSLLNQLCAILEKDPVQSKRLYFLLCDTMHNMKLIDPSYKMGGFELVQGRYVDAVYHLISAARATIGNENPSIPRPLGSYTSLYQDQFRETGFIAGGGFGNVFRAVHKLDEVEYAIKKIIVPPGRVGNIMSHLEEVRTLAKLNHTNIVSYKQAWIETMAAPCVPQLVANEECRNSNEMCENKTSHCPNLESKFRSCSTAHYISRNTPVRSSKQQNFSHKSENVQEDNHQSEESSSDVVSFRGDDGRDSSIDSESGEIIEMNSRTTTDESISSDDSSKSHALCRLSPQTSQYTVLYIQMTLCEKTLRQWLDERLELTPLPVVASIAMQILSGLNYIHSLGIVHHDIKPSNIFISTSGKLKVQLGDFGLACPLQRESHDAIVGTTLYAAPEQLKGDCNPKSDIYSFGIVLLELLVPMQTSMECIKIVESLKAGEVPSTIPLSHMKWMDTIRQLIQKNPIKRPSTNELLEEFKIDKDLMITKLQDENTSLKSEIDLLKVENRDKDNIIRNQESLIAELQTKLAKLSSKTEHV